MVRSSNFCPLFGGVRYSGCPLIRAFTAIEKGPFVEWIAATGGELTQYLWKQRRLQVLISKKDSTLENTRSLQMASWNNDGTTQIMTASAPLKIQHALNRNICQVHTKFMVASAVLK